MNTEMIAAESWASPTLDATQEFADDVVYSLGIGLAAGGAHDLAYKEFEDTFVAGPEFGGVVGISLDDFARGLLDGAGVVDLRETFGRDNFGGGRARYR